jgi:hypothetical protein
VPASVSKMDQSVVSDRWSSTAATCPDVGFKQPKNGCERVVFRNKAQPGLEVRGQLLNEAAATRIGERSARIGTQKLAPKLLSFLSAPRKQH